MPQSNQHLVHALLLWITILSLLQAAFIVLFFTTRGQSQNSSIVTPEPLFQPNSTPSPRLDHGEMMTFKASTEGNNGIKWEAKNTNSKLVSYNGNIIRIKKDGYYFISFQVTFKACSARSKSDSKVSLMWNDKEFLQGWINNNTCSTGLLGKTEILSYPDNLTIVMPDNSSEIDDSESLTHMDIIYIKKD